MLNFILLQAQGQGSGWSSILMIVALIAIFYFFMIRPQSQKQKKINQFRNSLQKGDKVMTAGGIYGIIKQIDDKKGVVMLAIADGVVIKIDRNSIYQSVQDIAETAADPQNKQ
ncbi:MAG: preprotein translocase subunit YajC [Bacteroidales bacterium]|nr:preprotein translocase subunit YajC [Candidatus Sodaliphilus aphodohippi]